jgi:serine kinase of HPr protein (carbohydrate metabolism regulator)
MSGRTPDETLLHASCVAIDDRAVLITGGSGSGKSDLALRLIDRGAILIADDATLVRHEGNFLIARAPTTIAGLMEVRGVGIVRFPYKHDISVALIVLSGCAVDRLPAPDVTQEVAGVAIPVIAVAAGEASAPVKVELALRRLAVGQEG